MSELLKVVDIRLAEHSERYTEQVKRLEDRSTTLRGKALIEVKEEIQDLAKMIGYLQQTRDWLVSIGKRLGQYDALA